MELAAAFASPACRQAGENGLDGFEEDSNF
jgi:hypothetical protein